MRRILAAITVCVLAITTFGPASAGTSEGGVSSSNVKWLKFLPFEVGTETGARIIGKYMYFTSWKTFSIYDVSNATNPKLMSQTPFAKDVPDTGSPFRFENEDVSTNGKILIFSQQLPYSDLYVYDIEDKTNPVLLATLLNGGNHTMSCLDNCKWLYGSSGTIIDLRDPTHPKDAGNWLKGLPASSTHDETEITPGRVLTSSYPIMLLDTTNPLHPKLLASGRVKDPNVTLPVHSNLWPDSGNDDFFLLSTETNGHPRCEDPGGVRPPGAFWTWSANDWQKTHQFKVIDSYHVENGTETDGKPAANVLGCSAHWFQQHPTYHNGGLVAAGFYEHGSRFLHITHDGQIHEVGYFMPFSGSTSADFWVSDRIVYAIDYARGIDILKYSGSFYDK
ncbi:MAG: LVIVD repeat-containing protein [Actinomycetota bacterium]